MGIGRQDPTTVLGLQACSLLQTGLDLICFFLFLRRLTVSLRTPSIPLL
jgi:hypothetical protein